MRICSQVTEIVCNWGGERELEFYVMSQRKYPRMATGNRQGKEVMTAITLHPEADEGSSSQS